MYKRPSAEQQLHQVQQSNGRSGPDTFSPRSTFHAKYHEYLLRMSFRWGIALGSIYTFFFIAVDAHYSIMGSVGYMIALGIAYILFCKHRLSLSGQITCLALWAAPTFCVLFSGGLASPFLVWTLTAVYISGVLLGAISLALYAGASCTFLLILSLFPLENHFFFDEFISSSSRLGLQFATYAIASLFIVSYRIVDQRFRDNFEADLLHDKEAAELIARFKTQFLANMSHEIRTPMNGVIGMTSCLLETELNDEQKSCVEIIRSSGDLLLTIIDDILDLSAIEAGKMRLESCEFKLSVAIENVIELFSPLASSKGLLLSCIIEPTVPSVVVGDIGRFKQVLGNLISNAIKFTELGSITVRAHCPSQTIEKSSVRVDVADTGSGVSAELSNRLFQPFAQGEIRSTHGSRGSGLGLSICSKMSELMGGSIGVKSIEGEGSKFWFSVTFQVASHHIATPQHIRMLRRRSVLMVGGNSAVTATICEQLRLAGLFVHSLDSRPGSARICESVMKDFDFDLVIVDGFSSLSSEYSIILELIEKIRPGRTFPTIIIGEPKADSPSVSADHRVICFKGPFIQSKLLNMIAQAVGIKTPDDDHSARRVHNGSPVIAEKKQLRGKVLVAEDNMISQLVIRKMLESYNLKFHVVGTGSAAADAVRLTEYDAIFMDCWMPEMDGYEATIEIRRMEAEMNRKPTPIIGLSASVLQEDRIRCAQSGMTDFLAKPIERDTLLHLLERWLQAQEATDQQTTDHYPEEGPVVDDKVLEMIMELHEEDGSSKLLQEVIRLFESNTHIMLADLNKAVHLEEIKSVADIAHKLKGSCATLGARSMMRICHVIESQGRANHICDKKRTVNLVAHLQAEFRKTKRHLRNYEMEHVKHFNPCSTEIPSWQDLH